MGLFLQGGKIKNPLLLSAFSLSLLYAAVYGLAYVLTADLVAALVPPEGNFLQKWLPPSIISISASLLCSIPLFFVTDKRIVLGAFALLALYGVLTAGGIILGFQGESRAVLLTLLGLYLGLPAFWGNGVIWTLYTLKYRKKTERGLLD
ncbi:MAG: hypothetical protein LBQ88_03445 [Treponema sp.]|nr:hypothetical protein [Treponema sp.]